MSRSKEEIERIWKKYKKSRDKHLKGILAEQYLPVVNNVAWKMQARTPHNVTFDDLASAGVIGLLEAIERYDLRRGVTFQSYCGGRIHGAMLDYLRDLDHVPRLTRARSNRMQKAYCELERRHGRAPSDMELARKLRISLDRLDRLYGDLRGALPGELHRRKLEKDPTLFSLELMEDRKSTGPESLSQQRDLVRYFRAKLPMREGFVLMMYYIEELTLKEMATIMGISESRVCQLQNKAISRLQRQLKRRETSVA